MSNNSTIDQSSDDVPQPRDRAAHVAYILRQGQTVAEQAKALAEMVTEHKMSSRTAARELGVSDGWVKSRLALLETDQDIQEFASRVPDQIPSLLLVNGVKDDAELRSKLLQEVEGGMKFRDIQGRIRMHERLARVRREVGRQQVVYDTNAEVAAAITGLDFHAGQLAARWERLPEEQRLEHKPQLQNVQGLLSLIS